MPAQTARSGAGTLGRVHFPVSLKEADVHRLTTESDYAQADAWQRAGHVRDASGGNGDLRAQVVGAWRRVNPVSVAGTNTGQLQVSCSCESGGLIDGKYLCRHAAALLLQWVRDPGSFVPEALASAMEYGMDSESAEPDEPESPPAEYSRLLEADTMNHLRVIARRRGLKVVARNKVEMVEQLAAALSQPESVDAALAGLGDNERYALEAVDLIGLVTTATPHAIGRAYRALGGKGEIRAGAPVALDALIDLGLLMPAERQVQPAYSYLIPAVVSQRLEAGAAGPDPVTRLVRKVDAAKIAERRKGPWGGKGAFDRPRLGLIEVIQVIIHQLAAGAIGKEMPELTPQSVAGAPAGWQIDKTLTLEGQRKPDPYSRLYRLTPVPPLLTAADLNHLRQLTGQSIRMLDFVGGLLAALGLVDITAGKDGLRVVPQEEALYRLLAFPPLQRFQLLATLWLDLPDSLDLRMIVGHNRPLQLYYQSSYYAAPAAPEDATVRRFLVLLLARAARKDGPWYNVDSLLDLLWELVPDLLGSGQTHAGGWWFTDSKRGDARLKLDKRDDWQRVWKPLVTALITGPMRWLGLTEIATRGDELIAFRVRPWAASLAGQVVEEGTAAGMEPLTVEMDRRAGVPVVTVPAGSSDSGDRSLLARVGRLVEASPGGLRYQLLPGHLQIAFDDGVQGPDLIEALTAQAGGKLPQEVRSTLERWWNDFGTVRLYDELALIELSDDILLRELLATTSLDRALIHAFSPRVIAVDPAMVDALVAELTRVGHTPRVIENTK